MQGKRHRERGTGVYGAGRRGGASRRTLLHRRGKAVLQCVFGQVPDKRIIFVGRKEDDTTNLASRRNEVTVFIGSYDGSRGGRRFMDGDSKPFTGDFIGRYFFGGGDDY